MGRAFVSHGPDPSIAHRDRQASFARSALVLSSFTCRDHDEDHGTAFLAGVMGGEFLYVVGVTLDIAVISELLRLPD